MERGSTKHIMNTLQNFKYILVMEGLATGLVAGLVAVGYRMLLGLAEDFVFYMVDVIQGNLLYICGWFFFLLMLGQLISICLKIEPLISGSGIPQVEGEIMSWIDHKWYRVLILKVIAGALAVFGGCSLGREGPSIQMGAVAGKGIARVFHRVKMEEKLLLTCGAAAGLSAAFNAPLAGIMFALEEIHKNFSVSVLISVMCASVTGDFISSVVFGLSPAFEFVVEETLPLHYYGMILLLGVVSGVFGKVYNATTLKVQDLYEQLPFLKPHQRIYIPLLVAGIFALTMPQVLGGGHAMMELLSDGTPLILRTLFILLVVKFFFSLTCFGSGAAGGIFFPLLVLGSFVGAIFGLICVEVFGLPQEYLVNFIIMAMAGVFTAIVRAPITGIILIAEMSGTLSHLLPLAAVSIVSYLVANLLNCEPIYESLLQRLLTKQGVHQTGLSNEKRVVETVVEVNSVVCDQPIKDIAFPQHCLLISIKRGGEELIPHGDTILRCGDQLMVLLDDADAPYIEHELEKCCAGKFTS